MSILLLSDVHANIEALDAVLTDAEGQYGAVWFLGDVVGYGPDPNACVERLRELGPEHWLAGNHDWAAVGRMETREFNPDAREAAHWSGRQLSDGALDWLRQLQPRLDLGEELTLVHGSPRQPVWDYILDRSVATECFDHFASRLCLFGHTHVPAAYEDGVDGADRREFGVGAQLAVDHGRWLLNPGSVGQPRDGDPRASYGLLDAGTGTLTIRRVAYDVAAVQDKILKAGLPNRLAVRLDYGW
jgi:predicted phosphodiesterase